MQFLTENPILKDNFFLSEDESFHLKKVLRSKVGDRIKVFDGKIRWVCEIIDFKNSRAILRPLDKIIPDKKNFKLNLFFPFIERKRFEYVIKSATEFGIDSFTPLITECTQRHFVFDLNDKKERIFEILKSVVKQSERDSFPHINQCKNIDEIFKKNEKFIVLSKEKINGKIYCISDIINEVAQEVNIVVGPEAGFSEKDIFLMKDNIYPVKISSNTLRSETAAVGCVCLLSALLDGR